MWSLKLRERAVAGFEEGLTYEDVRERFGISRSSLLGYLKQRRETGSLAPKPHGGGARRILSELHRNVLKQLIRDDPGLFLRELAARFEQHTGQHIGLSTIARELRRMGLKRVKVERPFYPSDTSITHPKPEAYRGESLLLAPPTAFRKAYPTDLTDGQWEILEPLMPKARPGGRPEVHPRRELVNAMLYVLRNGCTWRSLPHDFPPWSTVYVYFREWRMNGLWKQLNDTLRPRVRLKAGRAEAPSAAILDSQSAKTTEKGGPVDTTVGSVSTAENVTSSSTRSACY